jgi:hypothetical protein
MKKVKKSIRIKGLKDELVFCKFKLKDSEPVLQHWHIRIGQIEAELKTLKRKK